MSFFLFKKLRCAVSGWTFQSSLVRKEEKRLRLTDPSPSFNLHVSHYFGVYQIPNLGLCYK